MDEITVTIRLLFTGNVSTEEVTDIQDRISELLESKADKLFESEEGELYDYELEIERGN
jgi:hypothetical protein